MITVPVGTQAVLTVPFADSTGAAVTPVSASYQVLDGDDQVLVTDTGVSVSGPTVDITVPADINAAVGARSIHLKMTLANGTVLFADTIYGVVEAVRLQFLKNTFQTYQQALFTARDLPGVTKFTSSVRDDQQLAMIEAFRRLTLLNYFIPWPEFVDVMNYLYPRYAWHITPRMWPQMTPDLYGQYPAAYHRAMQQAQVIEANAILTGNKMDDKIRAGLLAWSVGESKMMFKSGVSPLRPSVSRDTLNYLKGWLNNNYTITRS